MSDKRTLITLSLDGTPLGEASAKAVTDFYVAHNPEKQRGHEKRANLKRDKNRRDSFPVPRG